MESKPNESLVLFYKPQDINQSLVCILCFGYFRSAQTIKECLHTFCKSCIYKHFNDSEECPQCGVYLPLPLSQIRPDHLLQSLVIKLYPAMIQQDYEKEEKFYETKGLAAPDHIREYNLASKKQLILDSFSSANSIVDDTSEPRSTDISMEVLPIDSPPTGHTTTMMELDELFVGSPQTPSLDQSNSVNSTIPPAPQDNPKDPIITYPNIEAIENPKASAEAKEQPLLAAVEIVPELVSTTEDQSEDPPVTQTNHEAQEPQPSMQPIITPQSETPVIQESESQTMEVVVEPTSPNIPR